MRLVRHCMRTALAAEYLQAMHVPLRRARMSQGALRHDVREDAEERAVASALGLRPPRLDERALEGLHEWR
eukprot:8521436-Pyramimonas_sp.AAC.1